jgi:hypothetical protein
MATPFFTRIGEHPSGITQAYFRQGETCGICFDEKNDDHAVIPESCTSFATPKADLCTRMYQEFARIFPRLRPNAHGEQTRHIFHNGCLETWLKSQSNCPSCRNPIHPDATLTTFQKFRNETGRHPKIWGAIGAVFSVILANVVGMKLGMSRKAIKWLEWGTAAITYTALSTKLAQHRPIALRQM